MADISKFSDEYKNQRKFYESFEQKIRSLIQELLKIQSVKYHVVESRTKSLESFENKISRPSKSYTNPLGELTDLVGVRIIVIFTDDVPNVSQILNDNFNVVEAVEDYKTENMDEDKFGYLSTHFILTILEDRSKLLDWKPYKRLKFEVQIRSVVQHAWADVSHSLSYKNETDVPKNLRRRLNRIAGLLELADEEFIQIRNLREEQKVEANEVISRNDLSAELSRALIEQLINESGSVKKVIKQGMKAGFTVIDELSQDIEFIAEIHSICEMNEIETVAQFANILEKSNIKYFTAQFKASGALSGTQWTVSPNFLILLNFIRLPNRNLEIHSQWDDAIIKRVIEIADNYPLTA